MKPSNAAYFELDVVINVVVLLNVNFIICDRDWECWDQPGKCWERPLGWVEETWGCSGSRAWERGTRTPAPVPRGAHWPDCRCLTPR